MTNPKRFFIVFYSWETNSSSGIGMIDIISNDGTYPARDSLLEIIKKKRMEQDPTTKGYKVALTNIIELTEIDYRNWKK